MICHQHLIHSVGKSRLGPNNETLIDLRLFYYLRTEPNNGYPVREVKQSQRSDSAELHNLTKNVCLDFDARGTLCNRCINVIKR